MTNKKNWYVRVPRWGGAAVHPRYWEVVSAEAGSEEDQVYRTETILNGCGETVPTTSWYFPQEDEQACVCFIEHNWEKWDG